MTIAVCPYCSQLPPPPPIFSLGPPPKILSIEIYCSSRLLSSSSSQHKKFNSSSSSTTFLPITLGILFALLLSTGAIVLIKNRLIKRQRQRKYDHTSSTVNFNGHDHHHHHSNRTNFISLLNDTSTISTPDPCSIHEPFLRTELTHDYEQISSDNSSSQYYCLIYCRQCGNYHQTSRVSCTCHYRNETHPIE